MLGCITCMYVCVLSLYCIFDFILVGSFERLMDYPILGECLCFWYSTILKMCVHEEYYIVLIFQDNLVSMWYVMLMRNSNSLVSINHLQLDILPLVYKIWIITLWGSNALCTYYKPIKCEHPRYCHLELILETILFLCGIQLK